jgi:hypothetical protein
MELTKQKGNINMNQNEGDTHKRIILDNALQRFHENANEHQDIVNAHPERFEGCGVFFETIYFFLDEGMIDRCLYEARKVRNYFNEVLIGIITAEE